MRETVYSFTLRYHLPVPPIIKSLNFCFFKLCPLNYLDILALIKRKVCASATKQLRSYLQPVENSTLLNADVFIPLAIALAIRSKNFQERA